MIFEVTLGRSATLTSVPMEISAASLTSFSTSSSKTEERSASAICNRIPESKGQRSEHDRAHKLN